MHIMETASSQYAQSVSLEYQRLIQKRMRMETRSKRLKQELETLKHSIEDCRTTIAEYEDQELYPALEAHGQMLCLPLCETLLTRLPLELRNMVYMYLCPPAHVQIDHYDDQDAPKESCAHPPPPFESADLNAPHWWRVEFVGQEFLDELVQHWYRTSTFIIDASNSNDVRKLLDESPWGLDTLPRDLINNVSIRVWTNHFGGAELARYQETLQEVLRLIQTLKPTAKIDVNFQTPFSGPLRSVDHQRAEAFKASQVLRAMAIVFPLLTRLRGPIGSKVDGVVLHDGLTKLSPDMWETKYRLLKKMEN